MEDTIVPTKMAAMLLYGLLGGFLGTLEKLFLHPDKTWRKVLNMSTAWFISVPVGYSLMPILDENIFLSMWACSSLIMIARDFTIKDSILVGMLNGLFWLFLVIKSRIALMSF